MPTHSPTKLTRDWLTERNITHQVVEYWNPFAKRRIDLFGVIDIVALIEGKIFGIQCTSSANHATRMTKARAEVKIQEWLNCGGRFEVWSWKTKKVKGKKAQYIFRTESYA